MARFTKRLSDDFFGSIEARYTAFEHSLFPHGPANLPPHIPPGQVPQGLPLVLQTSVNRTVRVSLHSMICCQGLGRGAPVNPTRKT